jgi:hypothetical protein
VRPAPNSAIPKAARGDGPRGRYTQQRYRRFRPLPLAGEARCLVDRQASREGGLAAHQSGWVSPVDSPVTGRSFVGNLPIVPCATLPDPLRTVITKSPDCMSSTGLRRPHFIRAFSTSSRAVLFARGASGEVPACGSMSTKTVCALVTAAGNTCFFLFPAMAGEQQARINGRRMHRCRSIIASFRLRRGWIIAPCGGGAEDQAAPLPTSWQHKINGKQDAAISGSLRACRIRWCTAT